MNVAIFASLFHPHFGGVEELCRQLAIELRHQGHGAIVLTNRYPRSLPSHEVYQGTPVYRLPFREPNVGPKSAVTFALTRPLIDRRVRAILRQHAVGVAHVQCVSSNGYYALRASRAMSLPLVVTLQGELTMDATDLFARSAFARRTLADCMAAAGVVTGCSGKTLADGEAFFGRPLGDRGRVVFNGASVGDFAAAELHRRGRPYVFAIGRLVPQKGFDVLLRAFAADVPATHDLLLAGDGPERASLERLAAELGLGDRVVFLGRADRATVPGLFAGSAFFVLPSTADEGLPVVTAEAMAAGKAVVATRSGGAPEAVLDGVTGLIVDKGDVVGLGAAMRRVATDDGLLDRFAAAGRARSAAFAWPTIAAQYLAAYAAAGATA